MPNVTPGVPGQIPPHYNWPGYMNYYMYPPSGVDMNYYQRMPYMMPNMPGMMTPEQIALAQEAKVKSRERSRNASHERSIKSGKSSSKKSDK